MFTKAIFKNLSNVKNKLFVNLSDKFLQIMLIIYVCVAYKVLLLSISKISFWYIIKFKNILFLD